VIIVSTMIGVLLFSSSLFNISEQDSDNQLLSSYAVAAFAKAQKNAYFNNKQYLDQQQLFEEVPNLKPLDSEVDIIVSENRKRFSAVSEECTVTVVFHKAHWARGCLNKELLSEIVGFRRA
jgi:hypothetical protein